MWTAATTTPSTRRLFVNALAYWLNNTSTNLAFTDLYECIGTGSYPVSPSAIYFIARPVVGGHFSLLALGKAGGNSQTGTGSEGSLFGNDGTGALTESAAPYLSVTAAVATNSSFGTAKRDTPMPL